MLVKYDGLHINGTALSHKGFESEPRYRTQLICFPIEKIHSTIKFFMGLISS